MIDEKEVWGLLEFYMDLVEEQDKVIHCLGRVVSRQADALRLVENDRGLSDPILEEDMAAAKEAEERYHDHMGVGRDG